MQITATMVSQVRIDLLFKSGFILHIVESKKVIFVRNLSSFRSNVFNRMFSPP